MKFRRAKCFLSFLIILNTACGFNDHKNRSQNVSAETARTEYLDSLSCPSLIESLVTSSGKFVELTSGLNEKIISNGGNGYVLTLESSPDSEIYRSDKKPTTYEYSLQEDYSDRMVPIARFVFDTNNLQLYQENMSDGSLLKIDYDKKILEQYLHHCKK
jgi:hypothetical protein